MMHRKISCVDEPPDFELVWLPISIDKGNKTADNVVA